MPEEQKQKPNKFIGGDDEARAITAAIRRGIEEGKARRAKEKEKPKEVEKKQ